MKIIGIRHGEDTPGFRGGWAHTSLTDVGKQQVKNAAKTISIMKFSFDHIVSSDLERAKESAEILSNLLDKPLVIDSSWREYNNGIIAGLPNDYADRKYPHYIFANIDMDERFPEGETPREYYNRIKTALEKLIKENKDVLLVTHGGVLDILNHIEHNIPYSNSSKHKTYFENAQIVIFNF